MGKLAHWIVGRVKGNWIATAKDRQPWKSLIERGPGSTGVVEPRRHSAVVKSTYLLTRNHLCSVTFFSQTTSNKFFWKMLEINLLIFEFWQYISCSFTLFKWLVSCFKNAF